MPWHADWPDPPTGFELASRHCRDEVRRRLCLTAEARPLPSPTRRGPRRVLLPAGTRSKQLPRGPMRCPRARCLRTSVLRRHGPRRADHPEVDGAMKYRTVEDLLNEKRRGTTSEQQGAGSTGPSRGSVRRPDAEMSRLTFARSRLRCPRDPSAQGRARVTAVPQTASHPADRTGR